MQEQLCPSALILDLDGTTIRHQQEFFLDRALPIFESLNIYFGTRDEARALAQDQKLLGLLDSSPHSNAREKFWQEFNIDLEKDLPRPELEEGALELFECLRELKIPLGLVTARKMTKQQLRDYLEETSIWDNFSEVITGHTTSLRKVESFKEMCIALRAKPEDVISVGDLVDDLEDSESVGIGTFIGVLTGPVNPLFLQEKIREGGSPFRRLLAGNLKEVSCFLR